jgi:hypothetical protein
MPTLFDMLANAQNGQGLDLLARQFNLSREQAELALEALLPAFSQGFKRNVSDPYGIAAFMNALASNRHGQYFDQASSAFSPQGLAAGNDILDQLFGSKEMSRAIAGQAAQATGIGQDTLKQMLPAIAAMLMGGLFKQSTGQMPGARQAAGFGSNPLGEIIEEMMKQGGGLAGGQSAQPQAPQSQDPFDNPFGKVLQDMFGRGAGQASPQPQASPGASGDNPFGKILEEMLGGAGARQAEPDEPAQPRPRANPSGRPRNPYDDIFGDMFETGRKTRDEYQKGVEDIFDQFKRGMDRLR